MKIKTNKKFTLNDIKILKDLKCYDNIYHLTMENITEEEKLEYISDWENMRNKIEDWFFDKHYNKRADRIDVGKNEELYFFDTSKEGNNFYCLLDDFICDRNIKTRKEFYSEIKNIEKQMNDKKLSDKEKELLKNINCYDSKYELSLYESEQDEFDRYMEDKNNLKFLYEDYFSDNYYRLIHIVNVGLCRNLYFFIEEQTFEYNREEYIGLINKIINSYDINWNADQFNQIKNVNTKGE